jgi:sodium pump decarboxylase gamma subunit
MDELTLMQKFADPELIDKLTGAEKAAGSLVTMMMGMGITFAVLMLLWGCINLLTKVLDLKDRKHEASEKLLEAVVERAVAPAPVAAPAAAGAAAYEDESELVAVITAAIAASIGQPASSLVMSKIRRVKGNSTTSSQAGGNDSIASRKF